MLTIFLTNAHIYKPNTLKNDKSKCEFSGLENSKTVNDIFMTFPNESV